MTLDDYAKAVTVTLDTFNVSIANLANSLMPVGANTLTLLFFMGCAIGAIKMALGGLDLTEGLARLGQGLVVYFLVLACIQGHTFFKQTGMVHGNLGEVVAKSADWVVQKTGFDAYDATEPLAEMTAAAVSILNMDVTEIADAYKVKDENAGWWSQFKTAVTGAGKALLSLPDTIAGGLMSAAIGVATAVFLVLAGLIFTATVILADVGFAIALALGPIFIPWVIWKPMSFMFNGWLRFAISSGVTKIIAAFMCVAVGPLMSYVSDLSAKAVADEGYVGVVGAVQTFMPLLLLSLVIGLLAFSVPGIARGITGGANSGDLSMLAMRAITGGASKVAGKATSVIRSGSQGINAASSAVTSRMTPPQASRVRGAQASSMTSSNSGLGAAGGARQQTVAQSQARLKQLFR